MKIRFYKYLMGESWGLGPFINWGDRANIHIGLNLGWWDIGIIIKTEEDDDLPYTPDSPVGKVMSAFDTLAKCISKGLLGK